MAEEGGIFYPCFYADEFTLKEKQQFQAAASVEHCVSSIYLLPVLAFFFLLLQFGPGNNEYADQVCHQAHCVPLTHSGSCEHV